MKLSIESADKLQSALGQAIGYLTDNSCSDPDCCGGPYYTEADLQEAQDVLALYGLTIDD